MSIRRSIAWSFSEQTFQFGLQFASSVIIARLLTPDEMGIFILALAVATLLTSLRTFGVNNYLMREAELSQQKIRSAFGMMLVISWTLGLLLFLGRHGFAALYGRSGMADVIAILSIGFFLAPFGAPAAALLTREMRFKTLHNIGLTAGACGTLLSVYLAYNGFSYMALAWGTLLTVGLYALLPMLVMPRYALIWPSFVHWREILRFGGLLSLAQLVGTANAQGTRFILGLLTNPAVVGQFHRAAQVPTLYRKGVFGPVGRVLVPAWMRSLREGGSIAGGVEKLIALNTVLVWPVFLALSLIAVPFITIVFGEAWRPAGEIFAWVLIAQAIIAAAPPAEQVLVPHGLVARLLKLRCVTAAFSLSTAVVGASLGLEAFAISRILSAAFVATMTFVIIRQLIDLGVRRYGAIYLRSAVVAVITAIPAAVYGLGVAGEMTLMDLLFVIFSCGLLWIIAAAATRHFVWLEGVAVLRRYWAAKSVSS